ncbi:MAG: hypothetical protein MUP17_05250 [candidate division Zixibacteria bacterium]|nr:hypothetical protein [candidate division Zixibacteria bacterium]
MPEKHLLLKTQKNEIYKILLDTGLEPANFSWSEEAGISHPALTVSRLKFRDGHFYFQFDFTDYLGTLRHYSRFSPGREKAVDDNYTDSWGAQRAYALEWARHLKREIEAPDLWQEIEKYQATFSLVPPTKLLNEPIPAYEADQIGEALRLLTGEIKKQFKLTTQQNEFVRSKLDYLADAAKRQPRLDWVHTCIGVLMTIAVGLAMAPQEASRLWQLFKNLLGKFIHLIGP